LARQESSYDAQSQRVEAWEKRINEERQPPDKVMDAIGVKPCMVIGEVGAGKGRYTVHLARRVGSKGEGKKIEPDRLTISEQIKKGGAEAGFELVRIESFLPKDDIYILKVKDTN